MRCTSVKAFCQLFLVVRQYRDGCSRHTRCLRRTTNNYHFVGRHGWTAEWNRVICVHLSARVPCGLTILCAEESIWRSKGFVSFLFSMDYAHTFFFIITLLCKKMYSNYRYCSTEFSVYLTYKSLLYNVNSITQNYILYTLTENV